MRGPGQRRTAAWVARAASHERALALLAERRSLRVGLGCGVAHNLRLQCQISTDPGDRQQVLTVPCYQPCPALPPRPCRPGLASAPTPPDPGVDQQVEADHKGAQDELDVG